jgi:HlyD family secretion protein
MDNQAELKVSARQGAPPLSDRSRRRSGRRRFWAGGIAILAMLIIAATAWWRLSAPAPVRYVSSPVSRGDVTKTVTATGTVNPILTIIVGSYVSGVIQSLSCDYNTVVTAGQVCAKVDPRPYQAILDQYNGQLLRDQAILAKDRLDLVRYQTLAAQKSIARQQAEDQAYTVQQDEGTVKLDEALVEGAKLNLEYTNIVSPVNGTVVSRNVTQGQTVAASFQTPTLFLIATDLKKMQVDTNISESDIGGIAVGDKATFTVDAYPNRAFEGIVAQVRLSPQSVQNVVTYDVVVGVDNADLALMPGMTASTQIVVAQRKDVLYVPDQALRFAPGGQARARPAAPAGGQGRIWVLRDGKPVELTVVPGLDDGNVTEIVKGDFQPGDRVITGESGEQPSGASGLPLPRL